jgi:thioester reductase-like protein
LDWGCGQRLLEQPGLNPLCSRCSASALHPPSVTLKAVAPKSLLITGVTGLLGSYLVRDLLLDGRSLAVVVRRSRKQSAAARVETIVEHWEETLGKRLPRPTVLEGDLTRPLCGLDADALRWVGENCDELLNNAASLTFRGSDRQQEPWQTNVTGTSHVLTLARETGLRHFHHVSTAYVCGLRSGLIAEDDLDVGQGFGNDYERTKVEGEKLVRAAAGAAGGFLDTATIYRPSIIVGDSRTG